LFIVIHELKLVAIESCSEYGLYPEWEAIEEQTSHSEGVKLLIAPGATRW